MIYLGMISARDNEILKIQSFSQSAERDIFKNIFYKKKNGPLYIEFFYCFLQKKIVEHETHELDKVRFCVFRLKILFYNKNISII